jgi:microtubule-associated protein-like 6
VFVWATDIREEIKEQAALRIHSDSDCDSSDEEAPSARKVTTSDSTKSDESSQKDAKDSLTTTNATAKNVNDPLKTANDSTKNAKVLSKEPEEYEEDDYEEKSLRKRPPTTGGDEAMAVKPWKGAVREPSTWVDKPDMAERPDESLELSFVYGYRGWDTRNNINFAGSVASIVYHVAGVGIVLNSETHSQILNTEHDDDIISLCVHPQGHTIATGEVGKQPKIVIWDANTGVTLRVIKFHTKGVSHLAFSSNGKLIVSVGLDVDRTIAVHNIETGAIVGSGKVGKGIEIYSISVSGTGGSFIVAGKSIVKFWDMPDPEGGRVELSCKGGIFSKPCRTVVSSAYLGADPVTGMSDGSIYLWKGRAIFKTQQAHGEKSPVTAMMSLPAANSGISTGSSGDHGPRILTGGKDGSVHIWNSQLVKLWSFNLTTHLNTTLNNQIQAVSLKESKLVLGTIRGEIYEINVLTNEVIKLVDGHFEGELWGLASHPSKSRFVTCGDDKSVRIWDAKLRAPKAVVSVGEKARAVAFSPDGFQIAVGLFDGKVKILSEELNSEFKTVKVAPEWIQCIKYSPNGASLAVGSHDTKIYILETRNYSITSVCHGHHSFIREFDFNDRSDRLQSVSGDYEILFWNVSDGLQIKSASALRDEVWATYTCTLGWPVQVRKYLKSLVFTPVYCIVIVMIYFRAFGHPKPTEPT